MKRSTWSLCAVALLAGCRVDSDRDARALEGIRNELVAMGEADQRYRDVEAIMKMPRDERRAFMRAGQKADLEHRQYLKQVIARHGWPTRELVGKEAAHAAFLIVQHADQDPAFQASCLPVLEKAARRGEIPLSQLAYLTDRVRVKQGRPQLYGTQYPVKKDAKGAAIVDAKGRATYQLPIVEDIERLDERRRRAGLEPWIEYERSMAASQGREAVDRPRSAKR